MPEHPRGAVRRRAICIAAALGLCGAAGQPAPAQVATPIPPQKLDWYGDPKAPDFSGVWVRDDRASRSAASREGWTPWPPPLKAGFAAVWRKRVAAAAAGTRTDDPKRGCLPPGMPRFITGMTGAMLIMQTPGRVTLYRDGSPVRRVWLDGRPLPAAKDLENFYNGTAAGRIEGSDLVTDVRGFKDLPIDGTGIPHSDDLQVTERFHRIDTAALRVEVTLTDRTAYSRPMRSVVIYKAGDPRWEPTEFVCTPEKDFHPEMYVQ